MNDKTVEPNSELNKLDTNGDNVISQEEYEQSERRIRLELLKNQDQKEDQQLRMIWYSLISLLIFPILLIFSSLYGLDDAGKNLTEMSSIFFLTIGGLVSVFFGSQAIKKNGNGRGTVGTVVQNLFGVVTTTKKKILNFLFPQIYRVQNVIHL